ncbi:dTDP-4-dehydrorhamnose 3,5-epimerase [Chitinophagaceae bacterium LB-8]|uniref:dTDP-4-dehydrorhamnose 3,5-epimerase n=1 Tax=Paraflavisolibacter caeni TaxID=2982496 RepID=A0A9X2XNE8_9BACT|nr:dTDP-4-dehydrorhamnose 3,5-epimerase [Paraflavisolibacter caeni]MCU7548024.1 dTDP-4-dehydrorhamnose 3,5-epimerase [Paraflavisolibacter caeni]
MPFTKCEIPGLIIVEPTVFADSRGYFFEAYNQAVFNQNGITCNFVQDNQSKSSYGVIRGLHYQLNPHAQSKLVRVLEGVIYDVAVDIRKGSPTFGKHFGIELSADNKKQLLIPAGFAHGFSVLSETAVVMYKCDALYNKQSEGGIRFDDVTLGIDWKVEPARAIVSEKDLQLPVFKDSVSNFQF